jgi:hypothetical protein
MEEQVLWSTTEFLVKAVQRISPWATAEILQTLGAVVYENVDRLSQVRIPGLVSPSLTASIIG